jgi:hypothetical protein
MTTTPLARTFLAYVRQGLAAQITAPAGETATLPSRADLPVSIQVNTRTPLSLDVRAYGPGDVIGFDEGQVVRSEPAPATTDFEPNLLAVIEFARPDLPWLLTPGAPDPAHGRIRPWLCLVAVPAGAATITTAPGPALPALTCPLTALPDLTESWAWAHAQVTGAPGVSVDTLLTTPGAALSRLICPTRLLAGTAYLACLVPAFQAGVLAGLGQPSPPGPLTPAWTTGSPATMRLPVYYHWSFATGSYGDFASLAGRLRPRVIPAGLGLRDIDISAADPDIPTADTLAEPVLSMMGAVTGGETAPPVPAQFQHDLETVLGGGSSGVGPPVYGGWQAGTGAVLPAAGSGPQWLRELNLDPRHRAAAGLGTQVVQRLQEQLVAAAWAQAADMARANQMLAQGQLARTVSAAWRRKHLAGGAALAPGAATDRLVQLTGPAQGRVRPPGPPGVPPPAQTVTGQVAASAPVAATVSVPYRKAARPLGPLARRLGAAPGTPLPPPIGQITSGSLVVTPPVPAPPGMVALDSVSGGHINYSGITPAVISAASPWWTGGTTPVPDGFLSDLTAFEGTSTGIGWRVGRQLDFIGLPLGGWQPEQTLATTQGTTPPEAVAAAVAPIGLSPRNITPGLVMVSIDPPSQDRQFQLHIGTRVAADGTVSQWNPPVPILGFLLTAIPAMNLVTLDADADGLEEAVLFYVEQQSSGVQTAQFTVIGGLAMGPQAAPPVALPFVPSGPFGITAGVIAAVQPPTPFEDVLVWWITGPPGARTGQYVIGWQFTAMGPQSWSQPLTVPGPLPDTTVALGAALGDINATGTPDLVLFHVDQTAGPAGQPVFQGRYRIGWDLAATGAPTGGWSADRDIPGGWSGTASGGSLCLASLDSTRGQQLATMGTTLQQQAENVQSALLAPVTRPAPPPAPPPFTAAQLAGSVQNGLDPAATVPAFVLPQIQLAGATLAPAAGDPLTPLALAPSFPQPMYAPLRELAADMLLPAADAVPPDTVTLLLAEPAFIEAYLVGLNHEMSRLLTWRGFPVARGGTFFQYFWDRPAGSTAPPDIPPIAAWDPSVPLGGHATAVGAAGMLLLLVRGSLPARFPDLLVRASRAAFSPPPAGPGKIPTDVWVDPVFHGRAEPDISYYGFPLTAAAARSTAGATPDPGWFFVFAERPVQPRFGLEPVPQPPSYGGNPAHWADLTWGDLSASAAADAAVHQIRAATPPPGLTSVTLDQVTWGLNAAHMAQVTMRLPVQVAIHADEMLRGL